MEREIGRIRVTHEYFGWKGQYEAGSSLFFALSAPNGLPTSGIFIGVPSHLVEFVKEISDGEKVGVWHT